MATRKTVKRTGVSKTGYVNRPSQITRKTPTKRLKARRTKQVTRPVKGTFPNPASRGWGKSTWVYSVDYLNKQTIDDVEYGGTWNTIGLFRNEYDARLFARAVMKERNVTLRVFKHEKK